MYTSKYAWRSFFTIFHKGICSRKTYKVEGWDKDKVKEQIDVFLKGCQHKCACYITSVNYNVFEVEVDIAVEGNIHQQTNATEYIRTGIDNIIYIQENIQQH